MPADSTLAALERHAYAAVAADPSDKRKGRLTLTEKGKIVRDAYALPDALIQKVRKALVD